MGYVQEKIRAENARKVLPDVARKILAERRAARQVELAGEGISLVDYVPRVSKHLDKPLQLLPYAEALDGFSGKGLQLVIAAPPQHGKTVLTLHGLAKAMATAPRDTRFAYVTYSQNRADEVARDFQRIALDAGLKPEGPFRQWVAKTGTHVKFTSIGGALTGFPINSHGALIIDDPFKDGAEARSALRRELVWNWCWEVGITRVHPGGSVFVMATRWHEDDLSGRLIRNWGWRYLNLQALCEDESTDPMGRGLGEALWPEKRPREFLEAQQTRNPWSFAALYQGRPRPRGGALFEDPQRFDELPVGRPFRVAYGADLAYSKRTQSDWSVLVRLIECDGLYYVTGVLRQQARAPEFISESRAFRHERRGPVRWYGSSIEVKGVAEFIQERVPELNAMIATGDKFQRAQPVAEAWNAGRVLVPSPESPYYGEWTELFLDELTSFSGVNDPHDDQVDALGSAFDELADGAQFSKIAPVNNQLQAESWSRWGDDDARGF
jgi:predicted phage terminase large subunit-like protein